MAVSIWRGKLRTYWGSNSLLRPRVVHRDTGCHTNVTKSVAISVIYHKIKNIPFDFSRLLLCLFFRQIRETLNFLDYFQAYKNLYAELSTQTVDVFTVAWGAFSVQPRRRIAMVTG